MSAWSCLIVVLVANIEGTFIGWSAHALWTSHHPQTNARPNEDHS